MYPIYVNQDIVPDQQPFRVRNKLARVGKS